LWGSRKYKTNVLYFLGRPRLLCKQDCDEDRPQIFKDYNLYIISVKNGDYLLTKNSIYFKLPYPNTKIIEICKNDDSLLLSIGNSETSLIDNLRYSGLFEKKNILMNLFYLAHY